MLRITTSTNAKAATSYHQSSLSRQGEYYKEQIPAFYSGELGKRLEVNEVTTENFCDFVHNIHPNTKEKLTPINAANRRIGWDLTTLPPKSFSVLSAFTNDPALENAFVEANREMMLEAERHILAQHNTQKERYFEETANGCWASFHHKISRPVAHTYNGKKVFAGQPLEHIHNFLFSVTHSAKREKYLAIDPYLIFKNAPYLQAYFHTQLTNKLVKLGYEIERTSDAWEIKGISREIINRFSERTHTIEKLSQEKGITDEKAKSELGAKTRLSKNKSVPENELLSVWKTRLSAKELKDLQQIKNKKVQKNASPKLSVKHAIDRSLEHFLERQSVAEEKRVIAHAMTLCFGNGYTPKDFEKELNTRGNILKGIENQVALVTTKEMVRHENKLIEKAVALKGKYPSLNPNYIPKRDFLNTDQKKAVKEILSSNDGVIALEGKAGAGKTTMLQELSDGLQATNKKMVVIAPSSKAVDVLRKEGFTDASTIASFLIQSQQQNAIRNQVLCVDEASLSGVPTLSKVLDIAKAQKARVVLSGNIRQHSSPEFGDGLRILQQQAKIKTVHLQKNMRQRNAPLYKEAVDFIARGKTAQGFRVLDQKMKAVKEIPNHDKRMEFLADQYIQSINAKRKALIISPTNAEKEQISQIVREKLKAQGKLIGKSKVFDRLQNLSLTESQKKDAASYEQGQYIRFIRNSKNGFKAGRHYEVLSKHQSPKKETVIAVKDVQTGETLNLPYQNPKQYSVFQKSSIALNQGDLIKPTLNLKSKDRKSKLNNGTPQQIKGFTKQGDIVLANGKTLDKHAYHIAHNYVSTSHAAQGATVNDVYISMTEASLGAVNEQSLYVSVSRGKSKVQLVTDNKKALKRAIERTGERKTARELAAKHQRNFLQKEQRTHHKEQHKQHRNNEISKTIYKPTPLTKGFSQRRDR